MTSWSSRNVSPGNRRNWLPWRRRPFQASDDHNAVLGQGMNPDLNGAAVHRRQWLPVAQTRKHVLGSKGGNECEDNAGDSRDGGPPLPACLLKQQKHGIA